MAKPRTHSIWKVDRDILIDLVNKNTTIRRILIELGIGDSSGNYKFIKQRLLEENINYNHIPMGRGNGKGRPGHTKSEISIENIFIKDSKVARHTVKRRILKLNLLENKCKECEQLPTWNGKKLVLVLDHINGIGNDNRLENLRLLCPNCNSQTETFSGRNVKKNLK